jgi:hypothetical protein
MKFFILIATVMLSIFFSACERNDYQHPGYRSGKVK